MEAEYNGAQYPQGLEVLEQPRPCSEPQVQHASQSKVSEHVGPTHVVFLSPFESGSLVYKSTPGNVPGTKL